MLRLFHLQVLEEVEAAQREKEAIKKREKDHKQVLDRLRREKKQREAKDKAAKEEIERLWREEEENDVQEREKVLMICVHVRVLARV